jgi:hypothetical protein
MNTTSVTRRRFPFGPLVSTRTVWLVVGSWAPLAGLIAAVGVRGLARNEELIVQLVRLVLSCAVANMAFASRTRWRAMAWMASGAAIVMLLTSGRGDALTVMRGPDRSEPPWEDMMDYAALAAAWYALLAALLYRPAGRSSYEWADLTVGLATLWVASPLLATANLARTNFMPAYYASCGDPASWTLALTCARDFTPDYLHYRSDPVSKTLALMCGYPRWSWSSWTTGVHLAMIGLLPIAVALLALLRIIRRRRWVRLVENGRISGWRLMDAAAITAQRTDLPVLTGNGQGTVKVLARVPNTVDPYRTADTSEPVALVAVPAAVETRAETGEREPEVRKEGRAFWTNRWSNGPRATRRHSQTGRTANRHATKRPPR